MEYKKYDKAYLLRVDKGEEILECIDRLCKEQNITFASISGIGAVNKVKIGYFGTNEKKYYSTELEGTFEITALTGNVTRMNNEVYIHSHISISDSQYKVRGGHLNKAVVSATAEIILRSFAGDTDRNFSEKIGLNLLKF